MSDTREEHTVDSDLLRPTLEDSMENVKFGVEELGGLLQGSGLTVGLLDALAQAADLRLRDTSIQVIQYSHGQATNYTIESVPHRHRPI